MKPLAPDALSEIRGLTEAALQGLLHLKMTHNLVDYVVDARRTDWRSFVEELHAREYPIKGAGVIVTPDVLESEHIDEWQGGFLHDQEDASPDEIISDLNEYPLAAGSASFAFSVVEVFGNEVAELCKPGTIRAKGSWHENIKFDMETGTPEQGIAAMKTFAKVFGGDFLSVKATTIKRLSLLRVARNAYVHRRDTDIDFEVFLAYCLAIVCQIYFVCDPKATELRAYPWEPFDKEKWGRLGVRREGDARKSRPIERRRT